MKIILEAISAKKNGGGGFQIAYNFIKASKQHKDINWLYFVSEDLDTEIGDMFVEERDKTYFVFPTQLQLKTYSKSQRRLDSLIVVLKPDVLFSIIAPSFFRIKCKEVMRCANAWNYVQNVNEYAWSTQTVKQRMITRLKAAITCHYMKNTKYFVTQTETAKKSIIKLTKTDAKNVRVVPNVLPAVFNNVQVFKHKEDTLTHIVYVSAPYPHKNIDIIPEVARILIDKNISNFQFHVTIPENSLFISQFNKLLSKYSVERNVVNEGFQTQSQLIDLYSKCDIFFFPSLLETFSASLLEAMFFKMPIVAADFDFNREVAGDSALYFKPKNAKSAAEKIGRLMADKALYDDICEKEQQRILHYIDYDRYFKDTVDFLKMVGNE